MHSNGNNHHLVVTSYGLHQPHHHPHAHPQPHPVTVTSTSIVQGPAPAASPPVHAQQVQHTHPHAHVSSPQSIPATGQEQYYAQFTTAPPPQPQPHQPAPGAYPYASRPQGLPTFGGGKRTTGKRNQNGVWDDNTVYGVGNMAQYNSNPVGTLQERYQAMKIIPQYRVVQAEGASHCPTFSYQVFVADMVAMGCGSSKKQAKHQAAQAMLDKLDGRVPAQDGLQPLPAVTGAVGVGSNGTSNGSAPATTNVANGNTIGQLQELCVHKGLQMPKYDFESMDGQPHQRSFKIVVHVGCLTATGEGTSKKDAKRSAAGRMIKLVQAEISKGDVTGAIKKEEGASGEETEEAEDSITKGVADLKINRQVNTLTRKHSTVIQQFYSDLQENSGTKLLELHKTQLKGKNTDYVKMLADLAGEQKFEVTYVDFEDPSDNDEEQCIVQLSTLPVAVCYGTGRDQTAANQEAARNALNYLKMMTGKSATQKANGN